MMGLPNVLATGAMASSHFPTAATTVLGVGFVAAATIGSLAWFQSKRPLGWRDDKTEAEMRQPAQAKDAGYDRELVPAETAARQERERSTFKQIPETGEGYTIDREGLLNNYAIEPQMYINEPGDLEYKTVDERQEQAKTRAEVNQTDETGKLSLQADRRGKGVGMI